MRLTLFSALLCGVLVICGLVVPALENIIRANGMANATGK